MGGRIDSMCLSAAALGVFCLSLLWAWATSHYWSAGPLVATISLVGTLSALTFYSSRKRVGLSALVALVSAATTLIAVLAITLQRWEG